jgi:hypothetical protein
MTDMRRFWEYGLVVTVAIAIGLVVAAVVELAMAGSGNAVTTGADDLASMVVPAAAGLITTALGLEVGLRRLQGPRSRVGW